MYLKYTFFLFFIFLLAGGCSAKKHQLFLKNQTDTITSASSMQKSPYRIRPYDRLSILFYQYPELSTRTKENGEDLGVEVDEHGDLILPLVGRVHVSGMTLSQLQAHLFTCYSQYLEKSPALNVEVLNQKIYVLGEVKNPGALAYNKQAFITPLKAIAQRGGLSDFAKRNQIVIVRGERKRYQLLILDLTDMQSIAQNNIVLMPEDIVYVAHNRMKDLNLPLHGVSPSLEVINTLFNSVTMYKVLTQ